MQVTAFRINNHQIEYGEKLGEGGFGEVYKAKWNHNDVAVGRLAIVPSIEKAPSVAISRKRESFASLS